MALSVTVPGANGIVVDLAYDTQSNAALAGQIAAALQAALTAGTEHAAGNASVPPPPLGGRTGLFNQAVSGATALPRGYNDVVDSAANAVIIGSGGANQHILAGAGNLTFFATGGSGVVDTGGGNNLISIPQSDTGNWLIQLGSGADTVADRGTGSDTISPGPGANVVSLGGGQYQIISVGQDTITAGSGSTTVDASGAPATASELIYGGSGPLTFIGGAAGATIIGASGSTTVTGGSGPLDARGGADGSNSLTGGTGGATLFGAGNGDVLTANGLAPQALFAGAGSETLTGATATGADTFAGGAGSDQITGGLGADTYIGGSGHAVVNATGASNLFAFIDGAAGGSMVVSDLTSAAQVSIALIGYGPNEAANAIASQTPSANAVTLTLSDNTTITFENITHLSGSNVT